MSKSTVVCENPNCKKEFLKRNGEINRSKKVGRKQYCSRSCYGKSDDNVAFDSVSEEVKQRNKDNIKKYCGNLRDDHTPFRYFVKVSKNGGRKQEYDLDLTYLSNLWDEQGGICPITGYSLSLPLGTHGWAGEAMTRRASLDRINPTQGYIRGNVRFISYTANIALVKITDKELIEFCKAVAKNHE
jgi:hypothetical protein